MKKILFGFAALSFLVSSCKKDDDSSASGTRGTLTNGMWKITSSSAVIEYPAPIGTQTSDLFKLFPACQQDNLYRFNGDGTTTTDEGATKCNASDPQQSSSGNWTLSADEKQITMSVSGQSVTADILTVNSSTLTLKYITTYGGFKATTTTSYAHQ